MSLIAIITARGGSKRIPQKNIKAFMGKPMLAYAIEAAKNANIFDEIMVSTDNNDIADVAQKYGAKVPFMRSERTSNDFATTFDVLEEVLQEYRERGKEFEETCCIYPCVPFLTSHTLNDAYSIMKRSEVDALQPVCRYPAPIEWAMRLEEGLLVPNDKKAQLIRSQDLTPKYYDVGMFYFLKTGVMLREKTITPERTLGYIIEESECQDIDTIDDWHNAELKFRLLHANN